MLCLRSHTSREREKWEKDDLDLKVSASSFSSVILVFELRENLLYR